MAQQAEPDLPVPDNGATALRVARRARERNRDRVSDDLIFAQGLVLLKKQEAEIAKSGVALTHGLE